MRSHLICLLGGAVFTLPAKASSERHLTEILWRLDQLEKDNKEKDEKITCLLERTKYCPSSEMAARDQTSSRTTRLLTNHIASGQLPAFHARLSRDLTSVGLGHPIVFDLEIVDTTHSYEPLDGIFTVPLTGVYVFSWNLMTKESSGMDTILASSQGTLGYGFVSNADVWDNGGNLVMVKLNAGTHVLLRKASSYKNFLHERFSTFSRFLLTETDKSSTFVTVSI